MDIFWKYLSVLLAFIVVMLILLLTTKYLAYKSKKMSKGNYMHVVESLSLGVNNRIHLIKVDDEFFLISSSNKNVEFLARVDVKDFEEQEIKNPIAEVTDFTSILKKYLNNANFGNKAQSRGEKSNSSEIPVQSNAFKNNLEKLKHLNKSINGQRSENGQDKEI